MKVTFVAYNMDDEIIAKGTVSQIAKVLGVPTRTIVGDYKHIKWQYINNLEEIKEYEKNPKESPYNKREINELKKENKEMWEEPFHEDYSDELDTDYYVMAELVEESNTDEKTDFRRKYLESPKEGEQGTWYNPAVGSKAHTRWHKYGTIPMLAILAVVEIMIFVAKI